MATSSRPNIGLAARPKTRTPSDDMAPKNELIFIHYMDRDDLRERDPKLEVIDAIEGIERGVR